jgi:hypothetical protein
MRRSRSCGGRALRRRRRHGARAPSLSRRRATRATPMRHAPEFCRMTGAFPVIHRPNFAMLDFALEDSRLVSCDFVTRSGDSMSGRRLKDPASDTAAPGVASGAQAKHSLASRKTLRVGASAALAALVAATSAVTFFRADTPSVAADSTLKCLDRFGHYEPCVAQASAATPRPNDSTTGSPGSQRPASWTASAPSQRAGWTATALYKPTSWTATAVSQQTSWTTAAGEQPADPAASAPAEPHAVPTAKRTASASCRRRAVSCFFHALGRKLTHIATAVAAAGQPRPGTRERLQSDAANGPKRPS